MSARDHGRFWRLALLPSFFRELARLPQAWRPVLAIARQTFTESVRKKTFLLLVALILGLAGAAFWLPVIQEGEDRLKLVQSFCFGGTMFFGMLIAVFLAAQAVPEDVAERRIFSVLATPVARSHYLAGRWLGVAVVLAALAAGVWAASLVALPLYLRDLGSEESARLLAARRPVKPARAVWSDAGQRDAGPRFELETRRPVAFQLEGLTPDRLPAGPLVGRLALEAEQLNKEEWLRTYKVLVRYRNPDSGEASPWVERYGQVGKPLAFEGPGTLVSGGARPGRLEVQLVSADPRFKLGGHPRSLVVFGVREHFGWNFAKGLAAVWLQLSLIAALALAGSAYLTAPVAVVQALFVYLLGNLLDVLRAFAQTMGQRGLAGLAEDIATHPEGHGHAHAHEAAEQLPAAVAWLKQAILAFCDWFPDFTRFEVTPLVVERLAISASYLGQALLYASAYGAVFMLAGMLVFHYRQVDQP